MNPTALALALFALLTFSAAAQSNKIGIIDLRKVFDDYYKTKAADAKLKDQATDLDKERKALLDQYQKAIQDDATDSQAQFNVGRILVHKQNYQEGIHHLLKSLSTTDKENKPSYLYAVGAAYVRAGDRENGLRYLNLARQEAATLEQSKLVESIDNDLRTLGAQQTPR